MDPAHLYSPASTCDRIKDKCKIFPNIPKKRGIGRAGHRPRNRMGWTGEGQGADAPRKREKDHVHPSILDHERGGWTVSVC